MQVVGVSPKFHSFSTSNMKDWDILIDALIKFREERNWAQFHNPKDLALALSIEAAELNELFLWKKPEEANKEKVKEELADVLAYALLLADAYQLDIGQTVLDKIKLNAEKYPVEKARNNAKKYNEFE
jgi:NTP pyrophosphatase (non-canonical NTP hydrolase)